MDTQDNAMQNNVELSSKNQGVMLDLVRNTHSVFRREIDDWKLARLERNNPDRPRTHLMQEMYQDAMLDTHLTAVTENRILRIINKHFVIVDDKGITNPEKSQLIEKEWFFDALKFAMESVFYGYSLLHFIKDENNDIVDVKSIPRGHIIPERGIVIKNVHDEKGLLYNKFPDDLLFSSMYDTIGLLEKSAPMTILKRHSWASWDEFEQVFGMPIRIAKLGTMSDTVKKEVAGWLKTMGTASYGIFPQFADIEIKEANNRDAFNVFLKKIEAVDSQNSILINGQTMTTQDGSSHSQANVHQKTQDEITNADLKKLIFWINGKLLPMLRRLGYDISENERVDVERITDPIEKMKTDEKIMQNGYRLKTDYLERVYGVEIESVEPKEPVKEKK